MHAFYFILVRRRVVWRERGGGFIWSGNYHSYAQRPLTKWTWETSETGVRVSSHRRTFFGVRLAACVRRSRYKVVADTGLEDITQH